MLNTLLAFLAVTWVINFTPGPAMLHCVVSGVSGGPRAGITAALGVELGVFLYVLATVLGLTALLVAATTVYTTIRIAGILFLLYLAWSNLPRQGGGGISEKFTRSEPVSRPFLKGLALNVSNPKIALFFLALFPQFVPPTRAHWPELLALGLFFNASGLAVNISASLLGNRFAPAVARLGAARRVLVWVPSVVFLGLALYSAKELIPWTR